MTTMSRLHRIPAMQMDLRERPCPLEVRVLHRHHADICDIAPQQAEAFGASDRIFKQHTPPTEHNLRLLESVRKAILLRKPQEIVEAYYRAGRKKLMTSRSGLSGCHTIEAWNEIARENGMLNDLEWFYREWLTEARRDPETNLVVEYRDLVQQPRAIINLIEKHFGLPLSSTVVLSKKRYSRHPFYFYILPAIKMRVRASIHRRPRIHSTLRWLRRVLTRPTK